MDKFVGIDISKDSLDLCIEPGEEVLHLACDDKGITQAVLRLAKVAPALIVMEATGGLEMRLASELAAKGLPVASSIRGRRAISPKRRGNCEDRLG